MIERAVRSNPPMVVSVLAAVMVTLGLPGLASAICSSSPTYCPTQTASRHSLVLYSFSAGYASYSGSNTIHLGTFGGYLGACVDGTFYKVWDDYDDEWVPSLNSDSYLCAADGSDNITVLQTTFDCSGTTLGAFAYSGHALQLFGQAGNDTMRGGTGRDDLCGGSGRDSLYGSSGSDRLDGHDNGDSLEAGTNSDYSYGDYSGGWTGYGGGDKVFDHGSTNDDGFADVLYGGSLESYYDCLQEYTAYEGYVDCGSGEMDYSPHEATEPTCELFTTSCSTWGRTGEDAP